MCFLFKTIAAPLRDFETFAELNAWFNLHDELAMPSPNLCDDYSREARAIAETDGLFLSCELVWQGQCYGTQIFTAADLTNELDKDPSHIYHIANMAIVKADETNLADGVTTKDSGGNLVAARTPLTSCYYVDLNWKKLIRLTNFAPGGKY